MAKTVEDTLLVRMEASLRKFEKQMEAGRRAAEGAAVKSERAWKKAGDQISANSNRAATGLQRLTSVSGRGTFVLQNTANQIGDIAVQMQGGTSASRALGQQLPQLLGGFGALGGALGIVGPLLGTVAAVGLPVASALLSIGEGAQTAEQQMNEMRGVVQLLDESLDVLALTNDELIQKFGRQAAIVRDLIVALAELRVEKARDVLKEHADLAQIASEEFSQLARLTDHLGARLDGMATGERNYALQQLNQEAQVLADQFDITTEEALVLSRAFQGLYDAETAQEQSSALANLRAVMKGLGIETAAIPPEIRDAIGAMAEFGILTAEAEVKMGRLAAAARQVNVGVPLYEQGYSGDQLLPSAAMPAATPAAPAAPRPVRRSGGGGSGGFNRDLLEAERLVKDVRTEAEIYSDELERIEELHRRFPQVVTAEVRDRAVDALNDASQAAEGMARRLESSFENAFSALVTGAGSGREAVQALLADLARMAAQTAFKSLVGSSGFFGDAASFLFGGANANGNVFQGGRVTPFANGGVVGSPTFFPMAGGKTGLMGEAGPEAIMPLARVNGKLGVRTQGGGAGGRVMVDVRLSDDLNARIDSRAENVSTRVTRSGIEQYDRTMLPRSVQQIQKDPRRVR